MQTPKRSLAVAALVLACASAEAGATPAVDLSAHWDPLVTLVQQHPWNTVQWARGVYLGARLFAAGEAGVPFMAQRFVRARRAEEGVLSGLYLAVYGRDAEHQMVRRQLETDATKRTWLRAAFGDARAVVHTYENGREWAPAVGYLPSHSGGRRLAALCMASTDPLVRRCGMYWGAWVADGAFWAALRDRAARDPDALTRRFAGFLVQNAGRGDTEE